MRYSRQLKKLKSKIEMIMEIYRATIMSILMLVIVGWFCILFRALYLIQQGKVEESMKLRWVLNVLAYIMAFLLGMNLANMVNR